MLRIFIKVFRQKFLRKSFKDSEKLVGGFPENLPKIPKEIPSGITSEIFPRIPFRNCLKDAFQKPSCGLFGNVLRGLLKKTALRALSTENYL